MTVATALRQGAELLERGGIGVPRLTAEVLLMHALHRERAYLYAHPETELQEVEWIHYGRYLHERLQRKPTQYITRQQEFYGRRFNVTPDVLIPRPETEHLIEVALPMARDARRTIDVGTGSGAVAITLALETATRMIAIDISEPALAVAGRNARELGATTELLLADALDACADGCADLIVSNPPYVSEEDRATLSPEVRDWEPGLALFGGGDGLAFYRRLIPDAARVLLPGGRLVVELGASQSEAVAGMFSCGWEIPEVAPDLAGIDRVIHAQKRKI